MSDYPQDQAAFDALIASEEGCRVYLASIRWPKGFVCPQCGGTTAWALPPARWACRQCGRQTSLTAGTLFHDTRSPLSQWFQAIWYVTGQKQGASALGLQRLLGLGSYHTAWAWLQRLRRAMVRPGRDSLAGTVEVDETYWGARQPGKPGRSIAGKTIILVAVEHTGARLGRLRLARVPDVQGATLVATIRTAVAPGSTIETDGWSGYAGVSAAGYTHRVVRTSVADELLPRAHLVVSLLKRWLLGTHQGGVQESHLDYYLDEFTFRFNRRTSHSRGLLFRRVLEYAMTVDPLREMDLRATRPHI
jgi:transposase-like protein